MVKLVKDWYQRYFSDPATVLLLTLLLGTVLLVTMGRLLAPVIASVIIAYVLDWVAQQLQKMHLPRRLAVWIVFILFIGLFIFTIALLPLLWQQLIGLAQELPHMLVQGQKVLRELPERYPVIFASMQLDVWIADFKIEVARLGRTLVSASLASIPSLIALLVYIVLVPLMVYFFMMDKMKIIQWFSQFLPKNRRLLTQVWQEVNIQIGNYIRGKVVEIIIVWLTTYVLFAFMGLNYALLLSALVGFSVIIPYIGIIAVTLPIAIIGLLQWGWSSQLAYLMAGHLILQTIDANVVVPFLFSEAVSLHPIAIIIAILFFGGIWGFWGVFFAIPLATLVKAVIRAWFFSEVSYS